MLYVVIAYLWASISLYLLLGGADFGAGIVELVSRMNDRDRVRHVMHRAIGPVWEANHMWLIIAIVILFVGFPAIYIAISIYLHIPLVCMLLGIMARGTAFAFRNYDAVRDNLHTLYSRIFTLSSLITPFFLGIVAAATISGSVNPQAEDFIEAYIFSWLNWFGIATGFFTIAICGYLASIYIVGTLSNPVDTHLMTINISRFVYISLILAGIVFLTAYLDEIPLVTRVFGSLVGQIAIALAALSLFVQFILLKKKHYIYIRLTAGFQIIMVLFAVIFQYFPIFVYFKDGSALTLIQDESGHTTITLLGIALLIGSVFILPSLFYLMYSFDRKRMETPSTQSN